MISGLCWGHPWVLTRVIPEMLLGRTTRLQPFRDEARALLLAPGSQTLLCDTPELGKAKGPGWASPPDGCEGPG